MGDHIGILLDLDATGATMIKEWRRTPGPGPSERVDVARPWRGSLTIYKNGVLLGVMATDLTSKYRWAVSLWDKEGDSVRIDPAPVPPPPTAEELDAAVARATAAAKATRVGAEAGAGAGAEAT